jgi:hypothetical protein
VQRAFDLRYIIGKESLEDKYDEATLDEVEQLVVDVAISVVKRLTHEQFSPLFDNIVEWASKPLPKEANLEESSRHLSLFNFLEEFMSTFRVGVMLSNYNEDVLIIIRNRSPFMPVPSSHWQRRFSKILIPGVLSALNCWLLSCGHSTPLSQTTRAVSHLPHLKLNNH